MTEYTVTIDNYESVLSAPVLREQIEEQFPQQDVNVDVRESPLE